MIRMPRRRQIDRQNQLSRPQVRIDLRSRSRQTVEPGERNHPFPTAALQENSRFERRQRNAHIRRMNRNTVIACAENRVRAVESAKRAAAAAR
jgi:hypothetical protein